MTKSPENQEIKQENIDSPDLDINEQIKLISSSFEYQKESGNDSPARKINQFSNITPSTSKGLESELNIKLSESTMEFPKHLMPFSTKPNLDQIFGNTDNIFTTIKNMESLNISPSKDQETSQALTPEASNEVIEKNAASNETDLIPNLPNMLSQLGFQFESASHIAQHSSLTIVKQEEINPFTSIQNANANTNNNSNIFFNNSNSGRNSPTLNIAIKQESEIPNLDNGNKSLSDYPRSFHSLRNLVSRNSSPYSPAGLNTLNRSPTTRSPPVLPDDVNMYGFDLLPKEYQSPSQTQLSSSNHNSINFSNANSSHSNTPRANSPSSPNLDSSRRRVINSSPSKRAKINHSYSTNPALGPKLQPANANNSDDRSISSTILSPSRFGSPGTLLSSLNPLSTPNGASSKAQTSKSDLNQHTTNKREFSESSTATNTKNVSLRLSKESSNTNVDKGGLASEPKIISKDNSHQSKKSQNLTSNNPVKSTSKPQVSKSSSGESAGSKKTPTDSHSQVQESGSQSKYTKDALSEDELTISKNSKSKKSIKKANTSRKQKTTRDHDDKPKRRIAKHKPQDSEYNPPKTSRSGRTLKPLGNFWENAIGYEIKPMPKFDYKSVGSHQKSKTNDS